MIISVKNIEKSFEDKKVLDKVSFSLTKDNIIALVGRNGTGKTTLLKIMSGIYDPDKGEVNLDEKSLKSDPKLIENIAYLPDKFDYFNYSKVSDIVDYYKLIYPKFDSDFFFKEIKEHDIKPKESIRDLSKGVKKLLGLITILATGAPILLIDEILDGMDVINKEIIKSYIIDAKESGKTVLSSSHELEDISAIADDILYLGENGKIEVIKDENKKFNKLQIIVRDELPQDIISQSIVRFKLARAYTVLIGLDEKEIEKLLQRDEIVQYDILPIQIEDSFYWERGKNYERL